MPEAKLAREAELSYCNVAMVTDFDAWHPHHDAVDVGQVVAVMKSNVALAKKFVLRLAKDFPREHEDCTVGSNRALDGAIMTAPEKRDAAMVQKLKTIAGRVLD
jgi:5'-methylthioadenosine phosphorylase